MFRKEMVSKMMDDQMYSYLLQHTREPEVRSADPVPPPGSRPEGIELQGSLPVGCRGTGLQSISCGSGHSPQLCCQCWVVPSICSW